MEEDSLRFWIIPVICLAAWVLVFTVAIEYKVNTVLPNAELERQEMSEMSCPEIIQKDSANRYWTSENSKIGRGIAAGCNIPQENESAGKNPYVEFCNPGGYAPDKKIENSTHSFNHDTCEWNLK